MKQAAILVCLGLLLAGPAEATSPPASESIEKAPPERVFDNLREVFGELKDRPANQVLAKLTVLLASPDFKLLEPKKQQGALLLAAQVAVKANEPNEAIRFMVAATDALPGSQAAWEIRFALAEHLKSPDAALALTGIAQRWPDGLRKIPDNMVQEVVGAAHDKPYALDLLGALYAARWAPSDPLESASDYWRDLALLLIKSGKPERALAVTKDITDPYVVISMRVDRRFDPLVKIAPDRFDVEQTAKAQLADLLGRADAASDRLEVINGVVVALLRRNRPAEALALADHLLDRIADKSGGAQFVDVDVEGPWTHDYRAYALQDLGRGGEAFDELEKAARLANPDQDLGQPINLAQYLYETGRPDEALAAVALLPDASAGAAMEISRIKVCSYAQKGEKTKADASMTYLRDHADVDLDAYTTGLLCENDQITLAKMYIDHLRNETQRADILLALQQYVRPASASEFVQTLEARRSAVLRRPDVVAAILAVGRGERWPLQAKTY